jgi:branched-chain amino acid transport system ATP-binding protein/neutral amino acid transport system ATP-binding protein
MGILSAASVVAGYSSADMVLRGLDLEVGNREIVAIIGPNGAGKSTFLKAVAGLVQPSQGTIAVLGHSVIGLKPREITRRGVAFVPQEANVFGTLTVRENLEMGGYVDPAGTRTRVPRLLERFPMLAEKRHQAARTLSGGQRQVLAMAERRAALAAQADQRLLVGPEIAMASGLAQRLARVEEARPHDQAAADRVREAVVGAAGVAQRREAAHQRHLEMAARELRDQALGMCSSRARLASAAMAWKWASIRPGISVRPRRSIVRASPRLGVVAAMSLMRPSSTTTATPSRSSGVLPSNRTALASTVVVMRRALRCHGRGASGEGSLQAPPRVNNRRRRAGASGRSLGPEKRLEISVRATPSMPVGSCSTARPRLCSPTSAWRTSCLGRREATAQGFDAPSA